jgi:hypothetical protein
MQKLRTALYNDLAIRQGLLVDAKRDSRVTAQHHELFGSFRKREIDRIGLMAETKWCNKWTSVVARKRNLHHHASFIEK